MSNARTHDLTDGSVSPCAPRVFLDEQAFHRAVRLERKRTDRSQTVFVLMLLDVTAIVAEDWDDVTLGRLISTLQASVRETDVLGWASSQTIIGILFTEISLELRKAILGVLHARVSAVLYDSLSFQQFSQISLTQHLCPENWEHDIPARPSHPALYPDLVDEEHVRGFFSVSKRLIDLSGSFVGLLLCAPLFLAIALAIKLSSSGPVLFRQVRVGQYGAPFVFLKFRSMYVGNDPKIHREYVKALINGGAERMASTGTGRAVYKLTRDPRITRIGSFLRKTSLDELPQLINVLKGEMSLVGPRPAIPYEVEAYRSWHRRRILEAKPGLTGLWQVSGRSRVSFDEMVRLDLRYAMARSLWLDLKILLQTPLAILLGDGAC
ncbi:MAG: sugar transferase [Bryobacteraceae bacterium]